MESHNNKRLRINESESDEEDESEHDSEFDTVDEESEDNSDDDKVENSPNLESDEEDEEPNDRLPLERAEMPELESPYYYLTAEKALTKLKSADYSKCRLNIIIFDHYRYPTANLSYKNIYKSICNGLKVPVDKRVNCFYKLSRFLCSISTEQKIPFEMIFETFDEIKGKNLVYIYNKV